jgi:hypothetical protein
VHGKVSWRNTLSFVSTNGMGKSFSVSVIARRPGKFNNPLSFDEKRHMRGCGSWVPSGSSDSEVGEKRDLGNLPAIWQAVCERFQKSLNTWNKVANPARFTTGSMERKLPAEVSRRLAECNTQLAALRESAPSNSPAKE